MKYKFIKMLDKKQVSTLHKLFKKEWWTSTRTKNDIKIMLKNTDIIIGIVNEEKKLIGFARILTDSIFKAEIYDIIIHDKYRNKKLGSALINKILKHEKLSNVKQFNLQCKEEMIPFYKKSGFIDDLGNLVYMRYLPNTYK